MRYENFVIQITTNGSGGVILRVSESPAGESSAQPAGPDSPLGRLLVQCRVSDRRLDGLLFEHGPEGLGRRLYDALMCGPIQRRFLETVGRSDSGAMEGIRIKLQVDLESSDLTEVHALPWEYLYRAETATFLALDRRFTVVRHLRLPVSRNLPESPVQLKLLVTAAVPRGYEPLATEEECCRIAESWQGDASRIKVSFLNRASLDRIRSRLLTEEFHGLHFIGHAQLDEVSGDGLLLLEDSRGEAAPCSGRDLAIQLADRTSLRWVFLNACSTAISSTQRPFGGLAAALLRTGIPAVLAMQRPVSDHAAVVFSHRVYQRLAAGDGMDAAVSEGRLAIHSQLPGSEWATPVLFLRSVDGNLFNRVQHKLPEVRSPDYELTIPAKRKLLDGWKIFLPSLLLISLFMINMTDIWPWFRPTVEHPETPRDAKLKAVEPAPDKFEAVTVREGEAVEISAFRANVSVDFEIIMGESLARLTVSISGRAQPIQKTLMGTTSMALDDDRSLSIQSIDWSSRKVVILPVRTD